MMKAGKHAKIEHFREVQRMGKHMALTVAPLQTDFDFAAEQSFKDKPNQFWRRTMIRCLLALTEAVIWNMKNMSVKIAAISTSILTPEELSIALEQRTVIRNGMPEVKPKYLPFRDNIKETFKIFAKVHGVPFVFNGGHTFDAFCDTYDLRSRLMHPKTPFDPDVSDSDIDTAKTGAGWFMKEWGDLMAACGKAASEITRER